jgi:large subunit ribosomal protein L18
MSYCVATLCSLLEIMKTIKNDKRRKRFRIKGRIRSQISGTSARPRLTVFRSNQNIYAQLIDDVAGITIVAASDEKTTKGTKIERAKEVGAKIAELGKSKDVSKVVFDRNGFSYIGRVKTLADSAREGGLDF